MLRMLTPRDLGIYWRRCDESPFGVEYTEEGAMKIFFYKIAWVLGFRRWVETRLALHRYLWEHAVLIREERAYIERETQRIKAVSAQVGPHMRLYKDIARCEEDRKHLRQMEEDYEYYKKHPEELLPPRAILTSGR